MENFEKTKYWNKAVCGGRRKHMLKLNPWDEMHDRRMHDDVKGGPGLKNLMGEMKHK